jgi:hypothetical protein
LSYAASFPLNPQILHAEGSRHVSQTFSLSIRDGIFSKMAFMVFVIGWFNAHEILLNVAEADSLSSGV